MAVWTVSTSPQSAMQTPTPSPQTTPMRDGHPTVESKSCYTPRISKRLPGKLRPVRLQRSNSTDQEEARTNRSRLLSGYIQKHTPQEPTPSPALFTSAPAAMVDLLRRCPVVNNAD